ncbi:MAG: diguanylate cyclase [Halanaerobiales bacterium]|nr:diguanylate cyclase [Halanaerobiales bacterium]
MQGHIYLFHQMTLIISFTFLIITFRNLYLNKKKEDTKKLLLFSSFMAGLLAMATMFEPFVSENKIFDLRSIPIILIAYLGGVKFGLIAIIPPLLYRFYHGGTLPLVELFNELLLPLVIGSIYYNKGIYKSNYKLIKTRRILSLFLVFAVIKTTVQFLFDNITVAVWLRFHLFSLAFSLIALSSMVLIINQDNKRYQLKEQIQYLAHYDYLTDLPNLRLFHKNSSSIIKGKLPVTIAMIDIDFFKEYNDTYGHLAGDRVLRGLSQVLKESIRNEDFVARYGGEEFIICLTGVADPEEAYIILNRLRNRIETIYFAGEENQPNGKLTISIGFSCSNGIKDLTQLKKEADRALYLSKTRGRNCVSNYLLA